MTEKVLIPRNEASKALSISLRTLERLIASGKIPVRRIGSRVLITPRTLQQFAAGENPESPETAEPVSV